MLRGSGRVSVVRGRARRRTGGIRPRHGADRPVLPAVGQILTAFIAGFDPGIRC